MITTKDVLLPDLGDFKDVPVIEVLVRPGDAIKVDDPVLVLESDKASMEVPSPAAGIVKDIKVAIGSRVSTGSLLLTLEDDGANPAALATPAAPAKPVASAKPDLAIAASIESRPISPSDQREANAHAPGLADTSTQPDNLVSIAPTRGPGLSHATPSVRHYARELGVDLASVIGTGPKGRILREDVQAFVKGRIESAAGGAGAPIPNILPWPQVDYAKFGETERQPLSRIKKLSGANLSRNWVMIPHVTNMDEADITDLEAFRLDVNKASASDPSASKVTMLAFLIKASAVTLKVFPQVNASLDGDDLVLKKYVHIGFAADTPNGLVVPVIRDCDRKGIRDIAAEASDLARQAREGKLKSADMQGGCFSISSLGGIGGTGFTPIINAPEVAILGATRAATKPVWDGQQFRPRLILPLCLSWDHRVIDGVLAARFLAHLSSLLADFRRVVL